MTGILIKVFTIYIAASLLYLSSIVSQLSALRAASSRSRSRDTKLVENAREEKLRSSLRLFLVWPFITARDYLSLHKDD